MYSKTVLMIAYYQYVKTIHQKLAYHFQNDVYNLLMFFEDYI